ncbi:exo-alpha-sialidase [Fulvivirga ulvae]|uniref:exo-alpha-sialidase n=1 Tax=Fulvivirga ulvae TaxID=2904245 RepID=UPI001F26AA86|nr:exo-alpha-sialidase [Fulvivirga ulvae]UII31790.1 exo-alpha-sialidase [Fulvivirga ulvae]
MRGTFLLIAISVSFSTCYQGGDEQKDEHHLMAITSPADSVSGEPHLFTDNHGEAYLSWVETSNDTSCLKYARLNKNRWSAPQIVARGESWFVNWADYPTVTAGTNQNLIAHFLKKSGTGTYAYDIKITHSGNGGRMWSKPVTIHDDGKQAEHGFVSTLRYNDQYFVCWLDGRNMVSTVGSDQHGHGSGHDSGAMSLRAALLDSTGTKIREWLLDDKVCDCCQTTAALTENGPVVIYRDRSDQEIRDISIVRWADSTWTAPRPVHADNWKIAGCPVNGPKAESIGNTLVVTWFSAPEGQPQVKLAFSENGGISFGRPIRVGSDKAIGRVDVILVSEEVAMVSWMEDNSIKVVRVDKTGAISTPVVITHASEARSSGFPQMTKRGDDIIFAWTDYEEKRVKTAIFNYVERK